MFGGIRRLALLAEGHFTLVDAKTAVGVLRYRPEEVVAVIDSTRAGSTTGACVGLGGDRPVVRGVAEAAALGADALMIGIAPQGGGLPEAWRALVREALERGWTVFSGLHVFLADDPELAALAARTGASIHDVRRPPAERVIGMGRASALDPTIVLTVGTDCNVGKMTAALELERELTRRGVRAAFIATGQTGIFVADSGVPIDAVVGDFAAGAIERLVLRAAEHAEVVIVEGQGSLHHPGYSGVTLALLHGCCPSALVLCHASGRDRIRGGHPGDPTWPMPSLAAARAANEAAAAWVRPAPVVAAALNTSALAESEARAAVREAAAALGVPASDPVRFGAGPIADAVLAAAGRSHAPHA